MPRREKYKEGFAVGKQLLEMEILCDNEYGDEEFSMIYSANLIVFPDDRDMDIFCSCPVYSLPVCTSRPPAKNHMVYAWSDSSNHGILFLI